MPSYRDGEDPLAPDDRLLDECWFVGQLPDTFDSPLLEFHEACECCRGVGRGAEVCEAAVQQQIDHLASWAMIEIRSGDRVRAVVAFDAVESAAEMACTICGLPAVPLLRTLSENPEWHTCSEDDDWLFRTFQEAMDCVSHEAGQDAGRQLVLQAKAEELSAQAEATCGRWIAACDDAQWFFQEPASREGVTAPVLVPREEVTEAYSRALRAWLDVLGIALGEDR